ncbi:YlmC/YmxH family sporulation protein [Halobacillus mangrovi]|uniref:YlmC/YmxH family sporulation protein n=1 Tax=Halobacillus mangrovi TaxID=402384 RepID=A0A1W5ZW13_9BACI|nr:YlmC/YmxH family sporulation protein [Halobacillus mangrovi]ARI77459.1 YlmC/YmxH family sporulation protein [Halobacillus mangrovi]
MRLKSLAKKEVIDVESGAKLGVLGKADLIIDPESGQIESLVILNLSLMGIGSMRKEMVINWEQIITIGEDTILLRKI